MMGSGCGNRPWGEGYVAPGNSDVASLEEVQEAVERYVDRLGYTGLHVTEVMEFERNYYAIVAEGETSIGAIELLVDKRSGAVGPEPGPNMMWNAKVARPLWDDGSWRHDGRLLGWRDGPFTRRGSGRGATLAGCQRGQAALPGRTAGEADPFYGYYTLHFLNDGEIEGMLSA